MEHWNFHVSAEELLTVVSFDKKMEMRDLKIAHIYVYTLFITFSLLSYEHCHGHSQRNSIENPDLQNYQKLSI